MPGSMISDKSEESQNNDDKTQQHTTTEEAVKQHPALAPPDGGREAWQTVLGCFLAFFASFGFVTAYGVFQSYYEQILPGYSSADISWIGSFQLWCITGMAIPSVILNAHMGPQITLSIGTFLTVFGVMMASLSTKFYQFFLSHGVCTGLGIGITFMPIVGLPNQWFTKRRAFAVGLAISGSSVGGVIWSIIVDQLLNYDNVGYPWTMRAIGFIQLATLAAAIALVRNNVPRNKSVKFSSFPFVSAFRQPGMVLFGLGLLLHFFGIYVPYFYASLYTQALGASAYTAFSVSAVLNAATFFGRFVMGIVADKIGRSNGLVICVFISAIIGFAWQGVNFIAGSFVWAVFYGWFSGASISLQSPAIIPLVPEGKIQLIGPYIALLCQFSSFGSLGGNPIAGALLRDRTGRRDVAARPGAFPYAPNDFHSMMWFTGSMLLGAVLFYQAARWMHTPNMLAKA